MPHATPRSTVVDIDGPVHLADYGGDPRLPTVLCVHGLGSSAVSWRRLAEELNSDHHIVAVDLPGHGQSPREGRSVGMEANTALLGHVLDRIGPAVLVGHSMGAGLAVLQALQRPADVRGIALLAPPMPRMPWEPMSPALAYRVALCAWPWLGRTALGARSRRLGAEEIVRRALALTCAASETVDEQTRQMLIQRAEAGGAEDHATFVDAARSVGLLVARAREYRRSIAALEVPGLVLHGAADRLVSATGLDQLAALQPAWSLAVLDEVGHSPHMETPAEVAAEVRAFSRTLDRAPIAPRFDPEPRSSRRPAALLEAVAAR